MENLSFWLETIKSYGIVLDVYEDKIIDIERLINSNLPRYEYYILALRQFLVDEEFVNKIYQSVNYSSVIRVVPVRNKIYARETLLNQTHKDAIKYIKSKIDVKDIEEYLVIINKYEEAVYSGIIVSSKTRLIIEIVRDIDTERLSHGKATPWHAEFSFSDCHRFRRMHYFSEVPTEIKIVMWSVVKRISKISSYEENIPNYVPMIGDFEFLITKNNEFKIIEYNDRLWKQID